MLSGIKLEHQSALKYGENNARFPKKILGFRLYPKLVKKSNFF